VDKTLGWNTEEYTLSVTADSVVLEGNLAVPPLAQGIVLFAHGSGSSRYSPRNRYVAHKLREAGMATLLIDLLTADEEAIDLRTKHQLRFDINFLASRLIGITDWLKNNPLTQNFPIGYFGASTGSGAALVAAAERPHFVDAIASRGGRLDLAIASIQRVKAPTLLIVGGNDMPIIEMNQEALAHLCTQKHLEIIPGATHLFQEPGALDEVARLTSQWFKRYLAPAVGQDLYQHEMSFN
jgi:putative phosphoribosyl transferase